MKATPRVVDPKRQALVDTLSAHIERYPEDRIRADHIRQFVRAHEDCFERSCEEGHITASAWIISPDADRFLLGLHRKLGTWVQLGGHADGDADTFAVAMREAREESGLLSLKGCDRLTARPLFDVEVHGIPRRGATPAHLHFDLRYLMVADPGEPLEKSDELDDLRWFVYVAQAPSLREEGLRRMAQRASVSVMTT